MPEMPCAAHEQPELIEAYLVGDLDEPAREAFEQHFFACDRCLAHLQLIETLQAGLRAEEQAIRGTSPAATRHVPWTWLAAAALLAIATGLGVWRPWMTPPPSQTASSANPPASESTGPRSDDVKPDVILALAAIDPPRYVALELRGTETAAGFAEAMRAYAARDYRAAAEGLLRVRQAGAADLETDFFLAVALMMSDRAAEAIAPLQRVVSHGDSPYQQLASLYLGKALLRTGNLDGAEAEWARTARLPGTHAREADDLVRGLRSARGRP